MDLQVLGLDIEYIQWVSGWCLPPTVGTTISHCMKWCYGCRWALLNHEDFPSVMKEPERLHRSKNVLCRKRQKDITIYAEVDLVQKFCCNICIFASPKLNPPANQSMRSVDEMNSLTMVILSLSPSLSPPHLCVLCLSLSPQKDRVDHIEMNFLQGRTYSKGVWRLQPDH